MRNNIVWRIMIWVMSIVLVGVAVFGLLLGNLRFRLLTDDLYQQTLLESDVYSRSAVAVLNQAGTDSDFIRTLTPEQIEIVATEVVPPSSVEEMVSLAVVQTFNYLNQPNAPSEIYVSAAPLRTYWEQFDIPATCALFADDTAALCQRDLPTILNTIQAMYKPEIQIDLDEQLRPPTGTVYELVQHSETVAIRSMLSALAGISIIGVLSLILKQLSQFWHWLWKLLLGSGLSLALSAFALWMATAGINKNIITEQNLTDDQLAHVVTNFLGHIGNQFINGILIQAGLLFLVALLIRFSIRTPNKHKQAV